MTGVLVMILITGGLIYLTSKTNLKVDSGKRIFADVATVDNQTIDLVQTEKILLQEAQNQNIDVAQAQVDSYISAALAQSEVTKEQLNEKLAENNMTYEQLEVQVRNQLIMAKIIDQNVNLSSITVSEEEIDAYLAAHSEEFSDFTQKPSLLPQLRMRIKYTLLQKKQTAAVMDYLKTVEQ
ncbi:MAG: SurA N-terminal domain-containing protein [Nanoarchaeota archaeon]